MRNLGAGFAVFAVLWGLLGTAIAQEDEAQSEDEILALAMDFAMNDATFTMYHEIGHMLVSELELPVLGKEEDAADALATLLLLIDESDDNSYNALIDAADGWYFNAVKSTGSGVEEFSYYDEHSLDIQRAYAMVCLMVGNNPEVFGETADIYELAPEQQEACAYTFQQALNSWLTLLEPHETGDDATSEPIEIIYEDAGDYEVFAEELKARGILEHAVQLITESYVLPNPVTLRATQCGEANAFYDPGNRELIYCYELAEDLFNLYIYDIAGWGDTGEDGAAE